MNRQIRFRVPMYEDTDKTVFSGFIGYDNSLENTGFWTEEPDFRDNLVSWGCTYADLPLPDSGPACQFTGLYDIEDKEIWEGDILEYFFKRVYSTDGFDLETDEETWIVEVRYDIPTASFGYTSKGLGWRHFHFYEEKKFKVIGNIYENPELLSGE